MGLDDLNKDGRLTKVELAERYKRKNGVEGSRGGPQRGGDPRSGDSRWGARPASGDSDRGDGGRQDSAKASASSSSRDSKSSSTRRPSKDDQIREHASSMITKYDKDGSGALEEKEWKDMRRPPKDTDGDKIVTLNELIVQYGGNPSGSSSKSTSRAPVTKRIGGSGYRVSSNEEVLKEKGVSSKFISSDANSDGNLQMAEYSEEWDEKTLDKFDELDLNQDGVISPSEWIKGGGR